jgi:hypothetical protein
MRDLHEVAHPQRGILRVGGIAAAGEIEREERVCFELWTVKGFAEIVLGAAEAVKKQYRLFSFTATRIVDREMATLMNELYCSSVHGL